MNDPRINKQQKAEPALRYDSQKLRMDLIPPDALADLSAVYTFGAKKYADRNWEKGMSWGRVVGSLLRHTFAWMAGESYDKESGLHHMAHVAWNAFTLLSYHNRDIGNDDRGEPCPYASELSTSSLPMTSSPEETGTPRFSIQQTVTTEQRPF